MMNNFHVRRSGATAIGCRKRWGIWGAAVLAHSLALFHRAAMAPMADRIMAEFDLTAAAFGGLGAVYFYIYAAMQLPSGSFADTLGPRRTIVAGMLLTTAGSMVMGLAPNFGTLYVGRILLSFGSSLTWLSLLKIIMGWFHSHEIGTVIGLSGSLNNCGQLLATTPLAFLIIGIGWRMSLVTAAFVSLLVGVLNWAVVKDTPARPGLDSGSEPQASGGPVVRPSLGKRFQQVFGNWNVWPLFLVAMGTYGSYATFFLNWLVVYLMQTYGITRDHAASFTLVSSIGAIVGMGGFGFISDRINSRRIPIITGTSMSLAGFLAIVLWNGGRPPLEALWPISFIMGFNLGAMPVTFAMVSRVVPSEVAGMSAGLVNMGGLAGAAVIQPLFGYVLDLHWAGEMAGGSRHYPVEAFQQAILLPAALMAMGFIGALLLREPHR
ncbi:MAG: MFS transporter [Desulfatiglandaceae bacterium]